MTQPIQEPSTSRSVSGLGWGERQLARRPAPPAAAGTGLSFCYAAKNSVSVTGLADSFYIADFSTGTTFKTNDGTVFPSIYHDAGKTPEYGIRIPANFLVEVSTWLQLLSDIADGQHSVGPVWDNSYTITDFGPSPSAEFTPAASSVIGLADDHSAPRALTRVDYLGDTADFTIGVVHRWYSWTTDPLYFLYGLNVTLIGALPT